jgi:hypothetical protein
MKRNKLIERKLKRKSHMKQLEFLLAKSQKRGTKLNKKKKSIDEAVTKIAKDELVEAEKMETVDTLNIDAEEDYQEDEDDEDDDGEQFALSIGAVRKE